MYEGRTRGKRVKYTFSDDEDVSYSDSATRRSTRNTGANTPAESGPITTLSGRQIKAPSRLNPTAEDDPSDNQQGGPYEVDWDIEVDPQEPSRRSGLPNSLSHHQGSVGSDEEPSEGGFGDDENDDGEAQISEESEDEDDFDDDERMVDDDLGEPQSLVVKLRVTPPRLRNALAPVDDRTMNTLEIPDLDNSKMNGATTDAQKPNGSSHSPNLAPSPNRDVSEHDRNRKQCSTSASIFNANSTSTAKESALHPTSLAFRGSPEKPQVAAPVQIFNLGKHE